MEVEAGAEVDRQRQLVREAGGLLGEEHPAPFRLHRQLDSGRRGELARPDAGRADHTLGLDRSARRLDPGDAAVTDDDPGGGTRLLDPRAELGRAPHVSLHHQLRRDVAGHGTEGGGQHVVNRERGHELTRLRRCEQTRVDPVTVLQLDRLLEARDVGDFGEQEQVAP